MVSGGVIRRGSRQLATLAWWVLALASASASARADGGVVAAPAEDTDLRDPWRPGLLAPGQLQLGLGGWLRLHARAVGLGPELWFGLGPRLTLGLTHGPDSDGLAAPDRGLCVRACGPRYRGAVTAHVALDDGARVLGRAAVVIDDVAPAVLAVELGLIVRWRQGRTWARLEPVLRLGLVGRDHDNRERAGVGLIAGVRLPAALSLAVAVEPRGPADETWLAGLIVPVGVELATALPADLALGLAVGTDDVLADGAGHASATLALAWRR